MAAASVNYFTTLRAGVDAYQQHGMPVGDVLPGVPPRGPSPMAMPERFVLQAPYYYSTIIVLL